MEGSRWRLRLYSAGVDKGAGAFLPQLWSDRAGVEKGTSASMAVRDRCGRMFRRDRGAAVFRRDRGAAKLSDRGGQAER